MRRNALVAQSAERPAVNRDVTGSNPVLGAEKNRGPKKHRESYEQFLPKCPYRLIGRTTATKKGTFMQRIKYAGGRYWVYYLPKHPDALSDGYVYEHRLVAEKMLHRRLKKKEYVHHKDNNGLNNALDNLMVFATNADHIRYHKGGKARCIDNVWYTESANPKCTECGRILTRKNKTGFCQKCISKQSRNKRPTKIQLEDELRKYPMIQIGKIHGVSDNAVRRWLKEYNLPTKHADIEKWKERK